MLEKEPLVSVCMPCYNHEEYVGQAIQSVLGQTYTNFELIIVDDASTDRSVEVIKSFNDPRIRVKVMEENTGFGAAEYMFEQMQGEFVCWLDSDDMWEETLLETYIGFLQEHKEYGVCLCKPLMIDGSGAVLQEEPFYSAFSDENMGKEQWFRKIYRQGNCFCSSTMCIRRELYDQVGKFRFQYKQIHDYDYWLRLLQVAEIYVYPESVARYRAHWEGDKPNVSMPTQEMLTRYETERAYILLEVTENLDKDFFVKTFSDLLKFQPEEDGFCLECEKFWMLKNSYMCPPLSAIFYYYRHYQDEDFQHYCKNVYGITNNLIYGMAGRIKEDPVKRHLPEREDALANLSFNPGKKPVIVWGAGKRTQVGFKDGLFNFPIAYIVDAGKSRKKLGGIEIIPPEDMTDWKNYYVIVTPKVYQDEIFQELSDKGLQYGSDCIGYEEFCEMQAEIYKTKMLRDINTEGTEVVLVPEWPIGDMCSIMGFVKAYKEKVKKSLAFYIIGKRGKEALELCPHIEHVEMIPSGCEDVLEDFFKEEKSRIFDMRLLFEGEDNLDAVKAVRRFFKLPKETEFDRFALKILPDTEKITRLFESFGLRRGKTVFIVPYANWFGPIGKELKSAGFWTKLCDALSREGYDVIFNSEEEVAAGVPYTFMGLSDLPGFVELCGNVVGMRTGLLNFIAIFTNVTIQCLWPEDDSVYFNTDRWKAFYKWGHLSESARSKEMMEAGIALTRETERTEKIFEFICQSDEEDIERIVRNLDRSCV